ncbi:MAG TPA: ribosomal protein S18-alanine N-acetyltransferase [Candidatus Avacidaminococcus intestinavium]|uniref:Ribosomal protein S18-alanine N-acetyltransferase n=1 Tax=Candidatus Avacidaminococcus intestinavium TaxID=2840684 RepID=A0A9D1MQ65_9FIRM|nr:ribosomal protein S18-alanine N-acetyltransferase [Candidatus Avacidaminococcus intestinavium]
MGKTLSKILKMRAMTKEDIQAVQSIDNATFFDCWSQEAWLEEITNELAIYQVLLHNAQIIGFAGFWLVAGEAQITKIAIAEEYRGYGMGQQLLQNVLAIIWQREAEAVTLEVRKSNHTAQELYKKNGFKVTGVRESYYADNSEDALILWLYQKELGEKNE